MTKLQRLDGRVDRIFRWLSVVMLIIILFSLISSQLDPDIWHILNNGRYVLADGVPHTEPFTMHEGLSYVAQQWLADCLFWVIYNRFGNLGLVVAVFVAAAAVYALLYCLLCLTTGGKKRLAFYAMFCTMLLMTTGFMRTRPQLISYISWLTELICLERYVRQGKKGMLVLLPVVSVIEVNCHAALWLLVPALIVPYLVELLPIRWKYLQANGSYSWKPLIAVLVAVLLTGFINPYGLRAMLLVFHSLSPDMAKYISEMNPLAFGDLLDIILLTAVFIVWLLFWIGKKPASVRAVLMLFGGTAAALMAYRNYPILLLAAMPFTVERIGHLLPEVSSEAEQNPEEMPRGKALAFRTGVKLLVCLCCVLVCCWRGSSIWKKFASPEPEEEAEALESIVDYLLAEQAETGIPVRLFSGFNTGAYCEFRGLLCYMDARAEVFLKSNNGVKDYLQEYFDVVSRGKTDYRELIAEYGFTHLLIEKDRNMLCRLLDTDDTLTIVCENDTYCLYAHSQ